MNTRDTITHEEERYDHTGRIIYVPALSPEQRRAIVDEFREYCQREFFVDDAFASGEDLYGSADPSYIVLSELSYSDLGLTGARRARGLRPFAFDRIWLSDPLDGESQNRPRSCRWAVVPGASDTEVGI